MRSRFIEEEHRRFQGEDGRDGDPLAFTAGECREPAVAQVADTHLREDEVHTPEHLRARGATLFHREGHFVHHRLGDGLRFRRLEDHPCDGCELPCGRADCVESRDVDPARDHAPVKLRDQTVEEPKERGLPSAGRPRQQAELAGADMH
ncbi:MAG: hypothetical protein IPI85_06470 [Dehalococcoidia bacterium]|nr:hypothetical protein [Dehalococcoidia bacterium]